MSVTELSIESPVRPRRADRPVVRTVVFVVVGALAALAVLAGRGWRPQASATRSDPASIAAGMPSSAQIEDRFGIRFTSAAITAGNGMIQLRYQVLDPQKAVALHDMSPVIIRSDGTVFDAPGIPGHSHSKNTADAGRAGYVLLANTNGGVRPATLVTIKVGDIVLKGVRVA